MKVLMDGSSVMNYGKQVEGYASELGDEINKLRRVIELINEAWNGADALKYINVMKEKYILGLEEMKTILEEYGVYLTKISDTYSSLDEAFMTKHIDV